jgi:hypothetical protein
MIALRVAVQEHCPGHQRPEDLLTIVRSLVPLPGKAFKKSAGAFVPLFQARIHAKLRDGGS